MPAESSSNGNEEISPQAEPAPTPLISSAHIPLEWHKTKRVPSERRNAIQPHTDRIADTAPGNSKSHALGKLGEDAVFQHLGIAEELNVEVITDGGDGGIDGRYNGASLQVKTVGREYEPQPELWVDAREPYSADYYILVSRVGVSNFRLIGYAPKWFVVNAPKRAYNGREYRVVDREYLFPFPFLRPQSP